jgi:ferredoxin
MPEQNAARCWRIEIDPRICVGSATCIAVAPDHFAFDDDDRSQPVLEMAEPDSALLTAAQMCPTGALTVTDTATGKAPRGLRS